MQTPKFLRLLNQSVDWAAECFFQALDRTALAVSMGFMVCGLWKMVLGLFILIGTSLPSWADGLWGWAGSVVGPSAPSELRHAAVDQALRGLELSLFAPMPFSLVNAVNLRLIEIGKRRPRSRVNTDNQPNQQAVDEDGEAGIIGAKAITLQLMAAIVATDMVDRATSIAGLTWESSICEILLIATLVACSLAIRKPFRSPTSR